jgi:hypothetical protein
MPVWRPPRQRDWDRLDAITAEPMRRCLGLPKSAHTRSLLVETNTLSTRNQFDVLSVTSCSRALLLPAQHQCRQVVLNQLTWRVPSTSLNKPIVALATRACTALGQPNAVKLDPKPIDRKALTRKALALQRLDWRKRGKGKRLFTLMPIGPFAPLYLSHDHRQIAIIRARLRFDRARLAESRRRRGELNIDPNCPHCGVLDDLDHLLYDCTLLPRDQLLADAEQAGLPISKPEFGRWLLGNLNTIDKKRASPALAISGKFLLAAACLRKL